MHINEALFEVQSRLKAPKGQYNSFGKYNYRSCEDIVEAAKPLLAEFKATILLSDEMILVGDRVYVKAHANFRIGNEVIQTTAYARESLTKKGMDDSQITGTASSYARKYALNGLLAIDDTKDADSTNQHGAEDKPAYPDKDFKANWSTWEGLIAEGKATPKQLIDRISGRFTLNDKQKELLNSLEAQNEAA